MAQIYYYDPQSAGINLQSPQSDSTPWTLTLGHGQEEWQTENLEKSSVENQEKVLQRILEGKYSCNKITTT